MDEMISERIGNRKIDQDEQCHNDAPFEQVFIKEECRDEDSFQEAEEEEEDDDDEELNTPAVNAVDDDDVNKLLLVEFKQEPPSPVVAEANNSDKVIEEEQELPVDEPFEQVFIKEEEPSSKFDASKLGVDQVPGSRNVETGVVAEKMPSRDKKILRKQSALNILIDAAQKVLLKGGSHPSVDDPEYIVPDHCSHLHVSGRLGIVSSKGEGDAIPETMEAMQEEREEKKKEMDTGAKEGKISSNVCSICNREFTYNSHLISHMRRHTKERPFECFVCNKTFMEKSHLTGHMRIHSGEKPFKCCICEKEFTEKGHLNKHMNIHMGNGPFECFICNKKFTDQSHFMRHMRMHSGARPFECSICQKTFSERDNLVKHMKIHSRDRPFKCFVCNKEFTAKSNLKRHLKLHGRFTNAP